MDIQGGKSIPVPTVQSNAPRGRKLSPRDAFAEGAWSAVNASLEIRDADIRNNKKSR